MTIELRKCSDSGTYPCGLCEKKCDPTKPFYGFINNGSDGSCEISNYKYLAIMDWDNCILDCDLALTSDSVQGFSSPAWGDGTKACCANSSQNPCCCDGCNDDPPCDNPTYKQNAVDGHRVYEDNGDGTATCIEATGFYASYLGGVTDACALRNGINGNIGTIQSDQYATSCGPTIPSYCCPNFTEDVPVAYMWND